LLVLAAAVISGWLLYLLAPILTPFLVAALLAYVWDPVVDRLELWRIPRTLGVVLVYLVLTLLFLVVVLVLTPILQEQLATFASKLPGYLDWIENNLAPWLATQFGVDPATLELSQLKQQLVAHWKEVSSWIKPVTAYVTRSSVSVALWLVNLVLVPVVTFYLLRDWDLLVARIHGLLPRSWQQRAGMLARETDEVLGSFLRGQLVVMLVLGTIYGVGLWLVGLDLALPIGMLSGLVSFVPYLGFIVGIVTAGVAALLQFKELIPLLWVLAVFGIGQLLEGMVLTPRLVGERVGLHPVAVIFAVMAGGQLFGFFGVLLAIPAAAAIAVWLRHLHGHLQGGPRRARRKTPKR